MARIDEIGQARTSCSKAKARQRPLMMKSIQRERTVVLAVLFVTTTWRCYRSGSLAFVVRNGFHKDCIIARLQRMSNQNDNGRAAPSKGGLFRLHRHESVTRSPTATAIAAASRHTEDMFAAMHRKEYEMKQLKQQHMSTTDPIRMAMSYAQESVSPMRLTKALRRVYEDPYNTANPNYVDKSVTDVKRTQQLEALGMNEVGMRKGAFVVDIKRQSKITHPGHSPFCRFDDAGRVAQAMIQLGADAVFVNTDFQAYGGDLSELKSTVRAVRKASPSAAVVMKDIVVDEIQLGLAKEANADGIILMSSVLGSSLERFLDLATVIGLEAIVECHTRNEVQQALEMMAPIIMVNNYDRIGQKYYPQQAIQLGGMFPGSGGPIITLATGGIDTVDQMKRHLAVGYDGVVIGKAVMGSPQAPQLIRAVRDRTLLPAELSQWGLEDVEFDIDGQYMPPP